MSSEAVQLEGYTIEEYYKAIEHYDHRTELIDGMILDMASPSIWHQTVSDGIITDMRLFVRKNGGKCRPMSAVDVKINDSTIVVPDIMIACDPEKFDKQKYNGAPDFVAEIVSTNRGHDLYYKLWLYSNAGVREYWIIDPKRERVSVYFFEESEYPEYYDFHTPIPVRIWNGELTLTIGEMGKV